jgi:hypothetical protein
LYVDDDDDNDEPEVVPEPRGMRRGKATATPATNGKPLSKAKAKGRPASTTNGHKSGSEPVTVVELDDDEPPVAKPPPPVKKGKARAGGPLFVEEGEIIEETESAASPELERMREERDLVRPFSAPVQAWQTTNLLCSTKPRARNYPKAC